jgi:hypothetical protein
VKGEPRQIKYLEIILTISLITIVAAILFPRGVVLFERAQISSIEYSASSFRGAVQAIHNKWLAEPTRVIRIGKKEEGEYTLFVNDQGWPVAFHDLGHPNRNRHEVLKLQCEKLWHVLLASQRVSKQEGELKDVVRTEQRDGYCEYVYLLLDEQYSIIYEPSVGVVRLKDNSF